MLNDKTYRACLDPSQPALLASVSAGEASSAQSSATSASTGGERNSEVENSGDKQERQVQVCWYDARARTALKKVAMWLNVPWTKVATFECLAAEQAQVSCHLTLFKRARLSE